MAVSDRTRRLVEDLLEECDGLSTRIRAYDEERAAIVRSDEQARRLASIPGVGVINATALSAVSTNETDSGFQLAEGFGLIAVTKERR